MKEHKWHLIVSVIGLVYYTFVATILLAFFIAQYDLTALFLTIIMLLSAIPDFVVYILFKQYKNLKKIGHIIWSTSVIIICTVLFFLKDDIDISIVCIIWGSVDIVRGLDELYTIFFDGKFEKKEIPFLVLSVIDVVLGIILIIKMEDGLTVHLIAATVSVFVYAIRQVFSIVSHSKEINDGQDYE